MFPKPSRHFTFNSLDLLLQRKPHWIRKIEFLLFFISSHSLFDWFGFLPISLRFHGSGRRNERRRRMKNFHIKRYLLFPMPCNLFFLKISSMWFINRRRTDDWNEIETIQRFVKPCMRISTTEGEDFSSLLNLSWDHSTDLCVNVWRFYWPIAAANDAVDSPLITVATAPTRQSGSFPLKKRKTERIIAQKIWVH